MRATCVRSLVACAACCCVTHAAASASFQRSRSASMPSRRSECTAKILESSAPHSAQVIVTCRVTSRKATE
eukprot:scaffold76019_cov66-Phaeocystis_antarctica.AAC.2